MTLQVEGTIAELGPWFHNLHLPDGRETAPDHPLGDFPTFKWQQIEDSLPADLSGARALDIGCNAGFYSFELAVRGAEVLALDLDEHYLQQGRWAAQFLDPEGRVEFRQGSVYDLVEIEGAFEVVLFMGVLYHLRYPLLALDVVAEKVGGTLVLQTLTMPAANSCRRDDFPTYGGTFVPSAVPEDVTLSERGRLLQPDWPRAAFIEDQLAGDPTNWWAADQACVEAMARSAGLRIADHPAHEVWICERNPQDDHACTLRTAELRAATRQLR